MPATHLYTTPPDINKYTEDLNKFIQDTIAGFGGPGAGGGGGGEAPAGGAPGGGGTGGGIPENNAIGGGGNIGGGVSPAGDGTPAGGGGGGGAPSSFVDDWMSRPDPAGGSGSPLPGGSTSAREDLEAVPGFPRQGDPGFPRQGDPGFPLPGDPGFPTLGGGTSARDDLDGFDQVGTAPGQVNGPPMGTAPGQVNANIGSPVVPPVAPPTAAEQAAALRALIKAGPQTQEELDKALLKYSPQQLAAAFPEFGGVPEYTTAAEEARKRAAAAAAAATSPVVAPPPVAPPPVAPPPVAPPPVAPPVVAPPVVAPPVVAPPVVPPTGIPVTMPTGPGEFGPGTMLPRPGTGGTPSGPVVPGYGVPTVPGAGIRPPGLNAFEDEVLKRQAAGISTSAFDVNLPPPPNSYERPMVPDQAGSPSAPASPARSMGNGSLDPHTLGSYKKLSDTFGTTRDRMGNAVASAVLPTTDAVRRGQLSAQAAGGGASMSNTLGTTTDRFGNVIAAPTMPAFFKEGGEAVSSGTYISDYLQQEQEKTDSADIDPLGTAQKYLTDLTGATKKLSPVRQSIKRPSRVAGGAESSKEMNLKLSPLAETKKMVLDTTSSPGEPKNTDSARAQMEAFVEKYKRKIEIAKNKARGLRANTLGAPTLEAPTLTRNTLAKKTFAEGGEAKKLDAEVAEPSLFGVSDYATKASARMFPDQLGQDDQRDAARHMLAAGIVARKFGPKAAELLGKAHEYTSNPQTFFSAIGIGKPRDDLPYDMHNNRIGAELAARATSQAELEALVKAMALQAQTKQTEGKPYIMSREQLEARKAKAEKGPAERPEYRAEGSPEEGEVSQEELDAASRPAFVTPKSGKGRKEGEISKQLKSGDAYANMAKGVTELPYDLAGAGVDLATMAMRPFGYSTEKPVMGSDWIKEQMTGSKAYQVRPEPPTDPTAKGFYTAGELLSNLVNPAGAVRAGVKGAEKVGQAATNVGKDFLEYNRQISVPGASYAVPPQGPAKTPAPASGLGFYSAAEQAALNLPRKEGSGAAFLNDLMKAPDVKKEELSAMGLDEFLKSKPKATREEVQDFIANNRLDVKEVQFGNMRDQAAKKEQEAAGKLVNLINAQDGASIRAEGTQGKMFSDEALYALQDGTTAPSQFPVEFQGAASSYLKAYEAAKNALNTKTKFDPYQLPGGENYREILLTIPGKKPPPVTSADDPRVRIEGSETQGWEVLVDGKTVQSYKPGVKESSVRDYALADANEAIERRATRNQYRSSHFDEPNILAHMRVNDRVDADGKKMLLIEELQSDWHQAGREKGYNTPQKRVEEQKKLDTLLAQRQQLLERRTQLEELASPYTSQNKDAPRDILDEWNSVSNQLNRLQTEQNRLGRDFGDTGVPDAPFKDTWHQLALKRALKYAADNGYERVGLTTGKQQSQRYDLGTQVDNISYEPTAKGFYINVISKDGPNVLNGDYSVKELEGIVGKELTQKMLAKEGKNEFNPEIEPDLAEIRRLDGVDLQLADKGMKKYYDEIYPAFLAKQAKKYGAQVGETNIRTQTSAPAYVDYIVGRGNFTDTTVLGLRADGSTEIVNQNANSLEEAQQLANRYKAKHLDGGKESVRYIDITPGMQGAVPYAKGGMVDKNTAFIKAHS